MSQLNFVRVWQTLQMVYCETRSSGNRGTVVRAVGRLSVDQLAIECQRTAWANGYAIPAAQIETGEVDGEPYAVWDRADHMTPAEADAVTAAAFDQIDAWESSGNAWPFKQSETGPTS